MLGTNPLKYKMDEIIKNYQLNYHVLESMADWVRILDDEGNVIFANEAMKKELGNDIIGKQCNIECEHRKAPGFCIVEDSIQDGQTRQKEEKINGSYYSVKSSPVRNKSGEIIGAVEVFRDVTRERILEHKLVEKNRKMNLDLEIAKTIQQEILPTPGVIDCIEVNYIYKPSEMLSGDMFDIYKIDEDNIGIYISDVAGHGISASMMTMFIRQTMRFIKDDILSPSIALSELHRRFKTLDLEIDKYFTIFYGVFNKSSYRFKYANAGHNCIPLMYNDISHGIGMLEITGSPISLLFDRVSYKENVIQLKKGDKLLLYTDGITEMRDSDGVEFGLDNLIKQVEEHDKNILKKLESYPEIYSNKELTDDFAMILLEVIK